MQQMGKRLRELREGRGWTRVQLGVYAGVSTATVSLVESGQRTPNAETLVKLAHALGVEPGDFFMESASPKVEAPTSPELSTETVSEEERRVTELLGSWGRHIERRAQAWEQQAAAEHKPYFGDWAGALQWGSDVSEEALEIFESAEEVASALVKEGAAVGKAVQELQRLEESYSRMWESIRAVGRRVSQALDTFTDQLKDTRSLERVRQARAWAEKEEEKRQARYEERLSRQVDAAEAG